MRVASGVSSTCASSSTRTSSSPPSISPAGPSAEIVRAWADERFDLVASDALIFELDDAVGRPKFRRWISESDAAEFVAALATAGNVVGDPSDPSPVSADPTDDYLIA